MTYLSGLRALNQQQRHTVLASFLGWTLDAFDFFLLTFAVTAIAADFKVGREQVFLAVTFTLAARPLGAFVFGRLAERYGRRPILMLDIVLFSVFEFATAFSYNLTTLILLRFLFGFAMGGEWGIGASLALESIPAKARGMVSGLLQEGYAVGGLLAGLTFGLLFDHIGWRGLFMVGALPALLVIYIRAKVQETPVFAATGVARPPLKAPAIEALRRHPRNFLVVIGARLAGFRNGRLADPGCLPGSAVPVAALVRLLSPALPRRRRRLGDRAALELRAREPRDAHDGEHGRDVRVQAQAEEVLGRVDPQ